MRCPNCGSTYFNVLLDLGQTNESEQYLTARDVVSCDNCHEEYTLGELADLADNIEFEED